MARPPTRGALLHLEVLAPQEVRDEQHLRSVDAEDDLRNREGGALLHHATAPDLEGLQRRRALRRLEGSGRRGNEEQAKSLHGVLTGIMV